MRSRRGNSQPPETESRSDAFKLQGFVPCIFFEQSSNCSFPVRSSIKPVQTRLHAFGGKTPRFFFPDLLKFIYRAAKQNHLSALPSASIKTLSRNCHHGVILVSFTAADATSACQKTISGKFDAATQHTFAPRAMPLLSMKAFAIGVRADAKITQERAPHCLRGAETASPDSAGNTQSIFQEPARSLEPDRFHRACWCVPRALPIVSGE